MGESRRRKDRGEYPEARAQFDPGAVKVGPGRLDWVYVDADGRVFRLKKSYGITDPKVVEAAHAAAQRREHGMVRAQDDSR